MTYHSEIISLDEARLSGIDINFERMNNGEKRYRLVSSDGSSYCRTVGPRLGTWQNSHYHKYTSEFYVVQEGWIVYAEIGNKEELNLRYLESGKSISVNPYAHHNIYISSNTIIHTIKCGRKNNEIDWFPSSELDQMTKVLKESDLLKIIN